MIEIDHLKKTFGPITAVDDISLTVGKGEVLGFLGPNGAGKSTTMKMITGFLPPSGGTARVAGFDVRTHPLEVKKRVGYLPEGAPMWPDMTPRGFLAFIARIRGFDGAEAEARTAGAVARTQLSDVLDQPIDTLSKGFKRRLGLAQALLHDPEVLILDEPTDGLDPNQKHEVRTLIHDMAGEKAIIISTHILEEVEAVCSRAVIIAHGRIVADDTPDNLVARSPRHNGFLLSAKNPGQIRPIMERLGNVASVTEEDGNRLFLQSKDGRMILDDVTGALREHNVQIEEVSVEHGRLDEVFRQITTA